jgi:phosphatidylglycerophosphate synthase
MTGLDGRPAALARLRRRWAALWAAGAAATAAGAWLLHTKGCDSSALRWALQTALVLVCVLARLGPALPLNHAPAGGPLRPALGAANGITLARSFLVAAVAGFILKPPCAAVAGATWAWAPGCLYLAASLLDAADGWLARATATESRLGEFLDTEIDALGLLAASLYLVAAGKAPAAYLLVGAGYYAVKAAKRLRRLSGRPVYDVAPRPSARLVAGVQMGFAGAAMLPVFGPAATRIGAWVMTAALLEGFLRDWQVVCGKASAEGAPLAPRRLRLERLAARALPIAARAAILACAARLLTPLPAGEPVPQLSSAETAWLAASAAACVSGVAARAAAVLLSVVSAVLADCGPAGPEAALLLACALVLVITGAGDRRLWQPEDRLLLRRRSCEPLEAPCPKPPKRP